MSRAKIAKSIVDRLPPKTWVWDTALGGLGVRRQKDAIVYYLRWQQDGQQRMHRLGRHGAVTVEQARSLAKQALGELAAGRQPFPSSPTNGAPSADVASTFGGQVPRFLAHQRSALKHRSVIEMTRHLCVHAAPFNQLVLAGISRRQIAALLEEVGRGSGPYARNQVRASLSSFWTWAIAEGLAEGNPVAGTNKAPQVSRDRVLADTELVAIWRALPTGDFGDIVRLLLLTGQRREEIGGLQWSEVNLADRLITLPAARVKNNRPHQVPLSEPASAILAARQAKANGEPAVFGRDGRDSFTNWSNTKAALDRRLPDLADWHLHDLRRTAATGMAELDVAPHIIEAVLNHASGHKASVAGIYNRAKYTGQMREALERWAAHIGDIVATQASPANGHPQAINVG
jgi:integrase